MMVNWGRPGLLSGSPVASAGRRVDVELQVLVLTVCNSQKCHRNSREVAILGYEAMEPSEPNGPITGALLLFPSRACHHHHGQLVREEAPIDSAKHQNLL